MKHHLQSHHITVNAQFEVQQIMIEGKRAYVRARLLASSTFSVSKGSTLGESRLASYLHEKPEGMFTFHLESAHDAHRFVKGAVVELCE